MVVLNEIDIDAGKFMKTPASEAFQEEAARVTKYLRFDDFDIGDGGVYDFHAGSFLYLRAGRDLAKDVAMDSGSEVGMTMISRTKVTSWLENSFIDDLQ